MEKYIIVGKKKEAIMLRINMNLGFITTVILILFWGLEPPMGAYSNPYQALVPEARRVGLISGNKHKIKFRIQNSKLYSKHQRRSG